MKKIILITTNNEIKVLYYPSGMTRQQNNILKSFIGESCDMLERVKPKRLYTEIGTNMSIDYSQSGQSVSMLVDEEFLCKDCYEINKIASYLYETDKHGYPILGNVLIVGEEWNCDGISFCGMQDSQFYLVYTKLKELLEEE